ncbi:MAG: PKD domain-containing protein [Crocinitomicaceae bacterium]|nr:PKD domain-containing protein [Crocinitomicaceae bacterium]
MKFINTLLVLFFISISLFIQLHAQCDGSPQGEQLQVINPSFEGPPGAHITPAPWSTCNITPDTQPGSWGVNLPASEGNTYVGFVQGGPAWLEGASQALSGNMIAGVEYTFTIDLAITNANQGGIIPAPAQLVIYGANALCQRTELLWTSPVINNLGWVTYTVTFTPTQNFSHIYFSISGDSPAMSYILLDNITPIVPNLPTIDITSHIDGMADGCSFIISGGLSLPLADSIVLTGAFIGSPSHANINGSNWNQTLNFNVTGPQTIYARVYYVDPATGANACSYDSVTVEVSSPIIGYDIQNHCLNTTANFTDTSYVLGIGSITSWNWDLGDGTTSTTASPSHTYATPGTYDVTLEIEDQNGCATTLTKQVVVHPLPVAGFTMTNACNGQSATFNSTATAGSGTIAQTLWDVQSDGTIDYTTTNGVHLYPNEGTFNVTQIVVTDQGCRDTITQAITVHPLPVANFTFVNNCDNEAVTFTGTSTVSSGTVNQTLWDVQSDGTVDYTTANGSHVYPNDGTFNIIHIAVTDQGCRDTVTYAITVHPLPVADFTFVNNCDNEAVTFTGTSTVSSGTVNQTLWDVQSDGTVDYTTANGSHVYPNDGTFNITHIAVTDQGCRDTVTQAITVHPLPVADFTFVNNCDNEAVTFTGTSTVSSGTVNQTLWDVQSDGTVDYTTANGSHVYPNDGTFNVTHIAVTDQGCRDTVTQAITVHPLPVADFTFVNNCDNEAVIFTGTSTVSSGTVNQTLWDVQSDGTVDYTTANGSHVYPNDGMFNVTHIAVTDQGCRDTITQAITVYPLPVADFSFVNSCDNGAITFTSEATVSSGTIDQTLWDVQSDGMIDYTAANGSHLYPTDGTFNIMHIVVTNQGCRDTVTQSVIVSPLPVADFSFVNNCDNEAVTFMATSTVSSGTIAQMLWDVQSDNTIDYTGANGSHVYPTDGIFNVTHIVVTDQGCRDTVTQSIMVYPLPVANWSAASVCEGNQTLFNDQSTVTVLDNDAIVQWQWLFGDGGSSTVQNPVHTYNEENVYTGQLIVTTNHGCKDTFSTTATVWPLPQVNFSPTDVCLEFLTDFQDLSTISNDHTPNSNVQWTWNFGDPASGISTLQNPSYAYQQDGIFNVQLQVTSANGCVNSATLPVTVHPKPQADFTGVNLSGCSPICAVLTSTSVVNNPSSITGYTWTLSDGTVYTSNSPTATFCLDNETDATVYYGVLLTVETNQGCVDSHSEQNYIAVYHNPVASFYANPGQVSTVDETTELVNESLYADSYLWNFGDGSPASTSANPTHAFPNEQGGNYTITLVASTNEGCRDTAVITIELLDELIFYIPNTFTPDGDIYNQTFQPVFTAGYDKYDYILYIFNRWGEMIFESHDASVGWDGTYGGTKCQEGTYTWKIEVKTLLSDERKSFVGHINLLR